MAWTEAQFRELCEKAGVKPEEVFKTGSLELDPRIREAERIARGPKIAAAKKKKAAFQRRGKKAYETRLDRGIPLSQPQSGTAHALVTQARRTAQGHESIDHRTRVTIIGYKVRPIDPDNFTGGCKTLIDCVAESGLLEEDSWEAIHLETRQIKVPSYTKECTVVEIEYLV